MPKSEKNLKPIKQQFVILMTALLIGFMLISGISAYLFFWPTFEAQDRESAVANAARVRNEIANEIENLHRFVGDWSIWDDTYAFVQDGNQVYSRSNLVPNTFTDIGLADAVYFNDRGEVVWLGRLNDAGTAIVPSPEELVSHLRSLMPVDVEGRAGLVRIAGLDYLLSFRGVSDSSGEAPPIGGMAMTIPLDHEFVDALKRRLQVDFELIQVADFDAVPGFNGKGDAEIVEGGYTITEDRQQTEISFLLPNLGQKGGLVARVHTPRLVTLQARRLFLWNGLTVLVSALALLWLVGRTLSRYVVRPLSDISSRVEGWEEGEASRLNLDHHESLEIGRISDAIVAMHNKITDLAWHDQLTGLANRRLLRDRLYLAIFRAEREKRSFFIMFIDLDGFKPINDRLGHYWGDQALVLVSKRLSETVRGVDTVARIGGDEFVVIGEVELGNREAIEQVCQRLIEEIERPMLLGDGTAELSASIGVAVYPDDSTDIDILMARADKAMYAAKAAGKATYCFADDEEAAQRA